MKKTTTKTTPLVPITGNQAPTKPPVTIYTDGACIPNPGAGGWGVYMNNGEKTKELWGAEPGETTNQRMELMAAIKGLEFFETEGRELHVFSDSEYLVKGMTEWIGGWIAKGWKKTKNADLWQRLLAASARHTVTYKWIKGHSGNFGNERADALANRGAAKAMAQR